MENIIEFKAEDQFKIKNLGVVFTGRCPIDSSWDKLSGELKERLVSVDGKIYRILGVETHATMFLHSLGMPIGLLVEELTCAID